ncbi:M43 family zinc metalloprotease [Nocardia sp. NPDC051570]|uniref:M43 family zinc metalloprotease n=1 Tax=Nocardia sp. NPDC051570 TaxID=3364324 RepID=UPI00379DE3A4
MKTALHKGDAKALNLYLNNLGGGLLRIATFPHDLRDNPQLDGVVVNDVALPAGSLNGYNTGKIATHEVGHWLGLYHPFQGRCQDPADTVADTPPENGPALKCVEGVKSCKSSTGDPMHNHMNYTPDACRNEFTQGQAQRAEDEWADYRQPRRT